MPLAPIDFSRYGYEPNYSGLANIFSNYYKGLELAQTPEKMARERLRDELMNSIYGEQLKGKQLENQYLPQEKELGITESKGKILGQDLLNQTNQAKLPYVGQTAEADYAAKILQNKIDEQKYANEPERFRNEQKKAIAEAAYREAEAAKTRTENEMKQRELELYNSDYQAEGGFPLQLMQPGERTETIKEMGRAEATAKGARTVNKTAKGMLELMKKHPNIADKFAQVWAHADENDPKVFDKIRRKISNKEDLAAFEKFRKDAARLVIAQADSTGGRVTDAKLKLIENMKASPGNTDEANRYMLEQLIYETDPAEAMLAAIEKGRNTRRRPSLDMEAYRKKIDLDNLPDPFK